MRLKTDHVHYHQVQLALYVCNNEFLWSNFFAFMGKGIAVERIEPATREHT